MAGREIFKYAVNKMVETSKIVLSRAGSATSDIAWVIPHQANLRIIEAAAKRLEVPMDKVVVNIASGSPITIRSFAEMACEEFGAPKSLLGFGDIPLRPDETMYFSGDPTRLMRLTGWRPQFDLRSGIRRSIEQFRNTK